MNVNTYNFQLGVAFYSNFLDDCLCGFEDEVEVIL